MIILVQRRRDGFEFELVMTPLHNEFALATHSAQTETELEIKAVLGAAADAIADILKAKLSERRLG